MALSTLDHLVAATLAASRAATFDLVARDEYLAEYDAFLRLMVARDAAERVAPSSDTSDLEAAQWEARHIPSSV